MNTGRTVIWICLLMTITVVVFAIWGVKNFEPPGGLNELGDSVAGFASSLALVWLVGSVIIQRGELVSMREEYQSMRESMQAQTKGIGRENAIQVARLYLESLESIAGQFFARAKTALGKIGAGTDLQIDPFTMFGFFELKCANLEAQEDKDSIASVIRFADPLSSDANRYRAVFNNMIRYIDSQDEAELIKEILIQNSKYEQVQTVISRDYDPGSLCSAVFSGEGPRA